MIGDFLANNISSQIGSFLSSPMKKHNGTKRPNTIMRNIDNNQNVNIFHPTSYRKDVDGEIEISDTKKGKDVYSIDSTAIADIKYDPENEIAEVQFTSGPKEYAYSVTPSEMRAMITAPSKGRWLAETWSKYNTINV